MDTDIYICSKPLQYFNVRNIGYGNASSKKVLIILGHFRDAELFFHQVKTFDDTWNDILYFKDLFHLDLYLFFPSKYVVRRGRCFFCLWNIF